MQPAFFLMEGELVSQLCLDELTVQTSNVSDSFTLRANSLACTSVRTVTEAQLIHLGNHSLDTLSSLYTTLRKQCQLAYLR